MVSAICTHEFGPFLPSLYVDPVDVRNVAAAHVWAVEKSELSTQHKRYIVSSGDCIHVTEMAKMLNQRYPKLKASERGMPWFVLKLVSFFDKRIWPDLLVNMATPSPGCSSERIKSEGFQFQYTSLEQTLADAYESMQKHGICKSL